MCVCVHGSKPWEVTLKSGETKTARIDERTRKNKTKTNIEGGKNRVFRIDCDCIYTGT